MSVEKVKVTWTDEHRKVLVDAMRDVDIQGDFCERGFGKCQWRTITDQFAEKTGINYEKQQLQSHVKELRSKFLMYRDIKGDCGFSIDSETKLAVANNDVWERYFTVHPKGKLFQTRPFPLYEDLEILFCGDNPEGNIARILSDGEKKRKRKVTQLDSEAPSEKIILSEKIVLTEKIILSEKIIPSEKIILSGKIVESSGSKSKADEGGKGESGGKVDGEVGGKGEAEVNGKVEEEVKRKDAAEVRSRGDDEGRVDKPTLQSSSSSSSSTSSSTSSSSSSLLSATTTAAQTKPIRSSTTLSKPPLNTSISAPVISTEKAEKNEKTEKISPIITEIKSKSFLTEALQVFTEKYSSKYSARQRVRFKNHLGNVINSAEIFLSALPDEIEIFIDDALGLNDVMSEVQKINMRTKNL